MFPDWPLSWCPGPWPRSTVAVPIAGLPTVHAGHVRQPVSSHNLPKWFPLHFFTGNSPCIPWHWHSSGFARISTVVYWSYKAVKLVDVVSGKDAGSQICIYISCMWCEWKTYILYVACKSSWKNAVFESHEIQTSSTAVHYMSAVWVGKLLTAEKE